MLGSVVLFSVIILYGIYYIIYIKYAITFIFNSPIPVHLEVGWVAGRTALEPSSGEPGY